MKNQTSGFRFDVRWGSIDIEYRTLSNGQNECRSRSTDLDGGETIYGEWSPTYRNMDQHGIIGATQ